MKTFLETGKVTEGDDEEDYDDEEEFDHDEL